MPDDAEVSNDLWDEVIECMKVRVRDKIHVVRTFAVRALSRFVNDSSNIDILDLFLEMLPLEQNAWYHPYALCEALFHRGSIRAATAKLL
ncbi:condensin complex subunit 3-like [Trifolium medium]|uniref:Condensin complex subunit 3-like n=1 Tax=Trifolium medium TaxID=97028 RepID=A0A392MR60_9FABA|nr:condensin complex subunit 3-like [Trifolium medium]